jgi:type IV secretion system protein TrbF
MTANPYVQGWREWDERYADLVLGKRNWQIAAGCALLISLVLAIGIVWLALHSRYVLFVVMTDQLGQAITIQSRSRLPECRSLPRGWSAGKYKRFISDARSVSSDSAVEQERLASLHAHARDAADRFSTTTTALFIVGEDGAIVLDRSVLGEPTGAVSRDSLRRLNL